MRIVTVVGAMGMLAGCGAAAGTAGTPQPRTFTQPIYVNGVRYTGRVIGNRDDVAVGAKVRAVFEDETPEFTLLKWELA